MAVPQEPAAGQLQALANPATPPATVPQLADGAETNEQVQLNKVFAKSSAFSLLLGSYPIFISLIRMRSKRDIKMGRLCTPGGAVLGIVGGGGGV